MSNDTQNASASRSGRPQTISYADLMKPDEDWRNLPDAAERRKIQNRLAQRAYRRNMRDRTKEVERLKKQLQKLQEAQDPTISDTSSVTSSASVSEQDTSASETSTPSMHSRACSFDMTTPPPTLSTQDWMNNYYPVWSQTPLQDDDLRGLGLTTDGENPMSFENDSYFPPMHGMDGYDANAASIRSRAVSASTVASPLQNPQPHMRSNSNPPFYSRCDNATMGPTWARAQRSDSRDSLQVPGMLDTHAGQNTMLTLSPAALSLYTSPEDLSLSMPDSSFCLDDMTPTAAYPTPPESNPSGTWSAFDPKSRPRAGASSTATTGVPLLHLAVESGQIDTLRLLLQRYDISIEAKDNSGYTALQRAVILGRTDMVSILLEHGADISGNNLYDLKHDAEMMKLDHH